MADFVDEPHAGIISDGITMPMNLVAHESDPARHAILILALEKPWKNLAELSIHVLMNAVVRAKPEERERLDTIKRLDRIVQPGSNEGSQQNNSLFPATGVERSG